jgi:hypothetical protein
MMLNGWPQQLDVVVATHGATPLAERLPKIMWRGRAEDEPRDEVRRAPVMSRFWALQGFAAEAVDNAVVMRQGRDRAHARATGQTSGGNE